MKLSIGIPAYNQGKFLRETIESVLDQKQAPLEIVVSDNHSTDVTPDVMAEFGDRIRCLRPPVHLDAHPHFDFMVSKMKGDWFSILSSDDIALPNYVETLARGTSRSSNTVLVWGDFDRIDGNGRFLRKKKFGTERLILSPPQTLLQQLDGPIFGLLAFATRKNVWEKVGGFSEECFLYGDVGFTLKLSAQGDFAYENETIALYRVGYRTPDENKRRLPSGARDIVTMYTEIIPRVAEEISGIDEATARNFLRIWWRNWLASASRELPADERNEVADIFEDWARDVGSKSELDAFRRGATIFRKPYGPLRKTLSQVSEVTRDFGRVVRNKCDRRHWRDRYSAK